jgi:hypothetical protein
MTVQTTSSAVGINPFTSGFTYILPNGIYVASDNSTAIFSFSSGTLDIAGSVIGFGGIRVGAIGTTSVIAIASSGTVIGNGAGGYGVTVTGYGDTPLNYLTNGAPPHLLICKAKQSALSREGSELSYHPRRKIKS